MGFFDRGALERFLGRFAGPDDPRERRDDEVRHEADVASAAIALENFRQALSTDHEDRVQLARARIMEAERARELFGCGIVVVPGDDRPDPWHESRLDIVVPITVAVTASEFVILREGVENVDADPMVEAGRFARDAFVDAVVTDAAGVTLEEPVEDSFAPPRPCRLVVRWRGAGPEPEQDLFAFRSAFVAAEAARRFRRAAGSKGSA
jgi:hypothetical protein